MEMYKEFMEFAHELITTEDLDPVYVMWAETAASEDTLKRWLLAYMCFYHCGVASVIAEVPSNDFYVMMQQAQNEKWPRGTERRHFRGEASQMCIDALEDGVQRFRHLLNRAERQLLFRKVERRLEIG